MSAFTYPGVYIQEISSGQHTITDVATSIAAFIGWAPQGPVSGPVMVESWSEYETTYGGLDSRSLLGYAVNQFFANGGTQAYILRLVANADSDATVIATTASNTVNGLPLYASSPGSWANSLSIAVSQPTVPNVGFGLTVSRVTNGVTTLLESYSNLSLSPASSQYVVTVINNDSDYITFINPNNTSASVQIPAASVTLTATASGSPPPAVQWEVATPNGSAGFNAPTPIPGATSTTYSFPASAATSGNQYTASFSNGVGPSATSATTLTVTPTAAPSITLPPLPQSVLVGGAATFTAAASGNPTPTVQWQVSTNNGNFYTPILGANTATYVATPTSSAQNGSLYQAVFTNSQGSTATTGALLTVSSASSAPVAGLIVAGQANPVPAGNPATFTATATGNPLPAVQWEVSTDGGATFAPITGNPSATTTTLTVPSVSSPPANWEYQATFTNGIAPDATTAPFTLAVGPAVPVSASITPAGSLSPGLGAIVTLTATSAGSPPPTLQWQVSTDGGVTYNNIPGATAQAFVFNATAAQNGMYQLVASNTPGSLVVSNAVTVKANTAPAAPLVTLALPATTAVPVGPPTGFMTASLGSGTGATAGVDGDILDPTNAINPNEFANTLFPVSATPASPGYMLFEQVQIFNLLCVPGYSDAPNITEYLLRYCNLRRALMIVDPPMNLKQGVLANSKTPLDGANLIFSSQYLSNAAYYFPWVSVPDPLFGGRAKLCPPSGFVAGIYASTDASRGVWKAPAGIDAALAGLMGFQYQLSDGQNGQLNPFGINCLRTFPTFGSVVWGARTMAGADLMGSEWKYVPVRRLALFLESSLYDGTQWAVFEPNDETLWGQVRMNVGTFMQDLFLKGAFAGSSPRLAYFVKCDGENNPPSSTALGILNIRVGFAPLYPAEFVVIQIQQIINQD